MGQFSSVFTFWLGTILPFVFAWTFWLECLCLTALTGLFQNLDRVFGEAIPLFRSCASGCRAERWKSSSSYAFSQKPSGFALKSTGIWSYLLFPSPSCCRLQASPWGWRSFDDVLRLFCSKAFLLALWSKSLTFIPSDQNILLHMVSGDWLYLMQI